jgi:CheY-like chemotaxis protein
MKVNANNNSGARDVKGRRFGLAVTGPAWFAPGPHDVAGPGKKSPSRPAWSRPLCGPPPGCGTKSPLTLRRYLANTPAPNRPLPFPVPPPGAPSPASILVVDDNLDVLKVLCETISQAGFEVVVAANGRLALELAERIQFDLMITDMIMPEQGGMETIMAFQRLYPKTKIMAMSGGSSGLCVGDSLSVARSLGVARTLVKPFSTTELMTSIRSELGLNSPGPGTSRET